MCRSTSVASLELGKRRRLGRRVVADDGHHAAVLRRAGEDAVADGVAGPIEPGRLAVPDADDAVVALVAERVDELAAHHRRGRQLLVDPGTDDDRQVGHRGGGGRGLLLERADGRTLVARHERRGAQSVPAVDAQLVDGEAGQRLHAGQEDAAVLEPEAVLAARSRQVGRSARSVIVVVVGPSNAPSPVRRGRREMTAASSADVFGPYGRAVEATGARRARAGRTGSPRRPGRTGPRSAGCGRCARRPGRPPHRSRRSAACPRGWRTSCPCSPRPAAAGWRRRVCPSCRQSTEARRYRVGASRTELRAGASSDEAWQDAAVIVVAGEALVDLVVTADGLVAAPGGAPYNVARACGRLGTPTALAACISDDGFGSRLRPELAASGVGRRPAAVQRPSDDAGARRARRRRCGQLPVLRRGHERAAAHSRAAARARRSRRHRRPRPRARADGQGESSPHGHRRPPSVLVVVDVNARPAAIHDRDAYLQRLHARDGPSRRRQGQPRGPRLPGAAGDRRTTAATSILDLGARVVLVTGGELDTTIVSHAGALDVAGRAGRGGRHDRRR